MNLFKRTCSSNFMAQERINVRKSIDTNRLRCYSLSIFIRKGFSHIVTESRIESILIEKAKLSCYYSSDTVVFMEELFAGDIRQNEADVEAIVDDLTLFDDDLMSRVFDKNIEATELLLGIVLDAKIKVISADGQDDLKNPMIGGRNITLDVHAIDEKGQHIDIEVQGDSKGAHVRRARYHSGVIDSRMLNEGQEFKELKDSYVIFMYKHDKFRKGLPVYHIDRYVRETKELFDDGAQSFL